MNSPLQPITVTRAELLLAISAGHITFPTYFLVSDAVSDTNEIIVVCNSAGIADEAYNKTLTETGTYDINADTWTASGGGGGVTDHGALTGLGDDDHPQYHNDARALTWLGTRTTNDLPETTNKRYVSDAQEAKIDFLTVTQPVDLDDIETRVNNLDAAVVLKGSWDASAGTFPGGGTAQAGYSYIVSVAGTVDGVSFNINDRIIAILDNASTSTFAANWFKADYTDQFLSLDGNVGTVTLGALIAALTDKATPVNGDLFAISDSAASNASKKVSWSNIKITLKTYFDTVYQAVGSYLTTTLTDGKIWVGNGSNVATAVTPSGDVTMDNAGVNTIKTNVALAGSPTTTTQSANDNSTKIATTAYADEATDMILVTTSVASNSPQIDFTLDTACTYKIIITNLVAQTNAALLWGRMGTGAGPTFQSGASDYSHVRNVVQVAGTTTSATNNPLGDGDDNQIVLIGAVSSTSTNSVSGEITIFDPTQTTAYHGLMALLRARDSSATPNTSVTTTSGDYKSTTAVTAFRLMMSTGNIASGTIKLYKVK